MAQQIKAILANRVLEVRGVVNRVIEVRGVLHNLLTKVRAAGTHAWTFTTSPADTLLRSFAKAQSQTWQFVSSAARAALTMQGKATQVWNMSVNKAQGLLSLLVHGSVTKMTLAASKAATRLGALYRLSDHDAKTLDDMANVSMTDLSMTYIDE